MGLQQRGVESRLLVHDGTPIEAGLRELETYAVRCGGGVNHRMGLDDAAKLTENHFCSQQMADVPGAAVTVVFVDVQTQRR